MDNQKTSVSGFKLYLRMISYSIRSQMQYKASYIMLFISGLFIYVFEFLGTWALFDRFGSINGWALYVVAVLYGMANVSFAVNDIIMKGFDRFSVHIKAGTFDHILLKPRSSWLMILGEKVDMVRFSRLLQGLVILIIGLLNLNVIISATSIMLLILAIIGGAFLFAGLFVLEATMCFYTTESLEIMSLTTFGGIQTIRYPFSIYRKVFRRLFTFVIPLSTVNYYPALVILGRSDNTNSIIGWLSPLCGIIFFLICIFVFQNIGVKKYRSTGS